ncbi:MAG TPA: family 10 glycosylhydrolase, partial [Planctomycetaceae bacterium]|nr:family 10 glycosylhydrolase [Planctomycetaceae bacterium]
MRPSTPHFACDPSPVNSRSLDILRWPLWAAVFAAVCAAHAAGAQDQPARIGPLRLRIEWSAAVSRTWNGVLEISDGRFESPISLGVEADEPGTLWIENDAVWIRRRSARTYDGLDVELVANPEAVLTMTLQSPEDGGPGERIQIRVRDLTTDERAWSLAADQGRLTIRRRPGDNLVVHTTRPHLIFEPGETFDFQLALHAAQHRDRPVKFSVDWELCRGRSTEPFLRGGQVLRTRLNPSHPLLFPMSVPLPAEEGVYDIHFKAQGRGMESLASHIQVLVFGSQRPEAVPSTEKAEAILVDTIEPATISPERLIAAPTSSPVPEPARGNSLLKFRWTNRREPEVPAVEEWQALRLKVRNPHRAHRVTMSLPRTSQHLGASILQPNASGQLMPVGIDSSIRVVEPKDQNAPAPQHEFTFWPNVTEPVLLCYSLLSDKSPQIERIEVHELPNAPVPTGKPTGPGDRWTGLYLEKPAFVKALGANEHLDPLTHRSLDDWETFSAGADRLCQHLRRHGYNCLLLGSLADGSTLFPCPVLQPTPRYDSGMLFSVVQDPIRKDVLELLYRRCDRDGLVLIPELQFSSPVPELEQAIREGQSRENGIELIGRDGRTWSESRGSDRGLAPRYNPLHPRVQEAITHVVQDVASRYSQHASFQGIAIELGGATSMSFPSLDWGYDEPTVARFEKAMRIRIPYRDGVSRHQQRYEYLTTQVSREWIQWRATELARFHLQLAKIVNDAKPPARTVFTAPRLLRHESSRDHLDDLLKSAGALEQLLLTRGIDPSRYSAPHVVLLRPQLWSGADGRLERAIDESVNSHPGLDTAFMASGQVTGTLLFRRPHERRLIEFDTVSPWQPAFTWLAPPGSVAGPEGRKSAVHALASLDTQMLFDGSWTLPLGSESATHQVRQTIQFLPAVRFHTVTSQQPAVVRSAHVRDHTYVYAVNDSAGAARVTLHLTCPATTGIEAADGTAKLRPDGE